MTKAHSVTEQLAASVDLFPTLAELAGLPASNGPQRIDGVSLVPVLRDPAMRVRDHAYHVYPKEKRGLAILTERYRLVQWQGGDNADSIEVELYDYESDPDETQNLAAKQPEVVAKVQAILDR